MKDKTLKLELYKTAAEKIMAGEHPSCYLNSDGTLSLENVHVEKTKSGSSSNMTFTCHDRHYVVSEYLYSTARIACYDGGWNSDRTVYGWMFSTTYFLRRGYEIGNDAFNSLILDWIRTGVMDLANNKAQELPHQAQRQLPQEDFNALTLA